MGNRTFQEAEHHVSENSEGLSVVVLSCGDLGREVAERLHNTRGVRNVALITATSR